jgi:hypothetical protein
MYNFHSINRLQRLRQSKKNNLIIGIISLALGLVAIFLTHNMLFMGVSFAVMSVCGIRYLTTACLIQRAKDQLTQLGIDYGAMVAI